MSDILERTIKIKDLQRVRLAQDDALIIRVRHHINASEAARIVDNFKRIFPNNEIIFLNGDLDVFVVRPGEQPPEVQE